MRIFGTKTFTITYSLEEQATKTLQEASEFYMAVRSYERDVINGTQFIPRSLEMAIDEGADVIQTVLNAFDLMGLSEEDVIDAMERCYQRNKSRGRVK